METINIEWSGGLSYISVNSEQMYDEDAQAMSFIRVLKPKEIIELSYNIDDVKYQNGDILEAIEFELLFKHNNGKIQAVALI